MYEYRCKDCEIIVEEFRKYDDRDLPASCLMCKGEATRTWATMPGITRASYIDSRKTARAAEFGDLKMAAKLESEAANLPPEKRGEIKKEIKKLKSLK